MTEKTNLGVKPIGRGEVTSPVVLREIASLKKYGEALRAFSPVDSEEKAMAHRAAFLVHLEDLGKYDQAKRVRKLHKSLGY